MSINARSPPSELVFSSKSCCALPPENSLFLNFIASVGLCALIGLIRLARSLYRRDVERADDIARALAVLELALIVGAMDLLPNCRKQSRRCADGSEDACRKRDAAYAEMRQLMPSVPYEPR